MSLRRLQIERIDLYYLHRIDPAVPLADQLGVLTGLQAEGKIGHIGLSKVTLEQVRVASALADIAAVQNKYNITDRTSEDVLRHCEVTGITFVPYALLASGALTSGVLDGLARDHGVTPTQLALASNLASGRGAGRNLAGTQARCCGVRGGDLPLCLDV